MQIEDPNAKNESQQVTPSLSTTIAGLFALAAFAVAIVAGLVSNNGALSILFRAVLAMVVCYPLGLIIGLVCERTIQEHLHHESEREDVSPEAEDDPPDEETTESGEEKIAAV